jgi:hypothetical protein
MAGIPQTFGVGSVSAITDAASVALDLASYLDQTICFKWTLGGNRTLTISNPIDGMKLCFFITQDGTGSRTLTVTNSVVSGTLLSTTAGATDIVTMQYRQDTGTWYVWSEGKAFA